MNDEQIQFMMVNILKQLAMIPTDDLETYIRDIEDNNQRFENVGAIVDPTAYRNALYNGELENAKAMLKITKGMLEVRRAIDEREALVKKWQQKQAGRNTDGSTS